MDGRLRRRQRGTRDRLRLIRRQRFRLLLSGRTPRGVWWPSAQYTINGGQPAPSKAAASAIVAPPRAVGRHSAAGNSRASRVCHGCEFQELTLAEDIKAADMVLVPKGSLAVATVTQVDKTGAGGAPGNIVFQVDSMDANGNLVKLWGSETLEGQPKPPNAALLVPYVGLFTLFRHGKDAEIKPGTPGNVIRRCRYFALDRGLGKRSHQLTTSPAQNSSACGFPMKTETSATDVSMVRGDRGHRV